LDRDGDGVINDGSEMFGNATPRPQPAAGTLRNGFLALAQYDDHRNCAFDDHGIEIVDAAEDRHHRW
jgi:hypothetical protein